MLVIIGANGRTGAEVVREAGRRGLPTRAVVRDDRDVSRLRGLVDPYALHYADADHPAALDAVLAGATRVLSLIDPRTQGHGAPRYGPRAAANIVEAAARAGAEKVLHVSVMGAYRWSRAALNRAAFKLDDGVVACAGPWGIVRISCYHDEIVEAHVRPADGGAPLRFDRSGRYAPCSRADAARMLLDHLDRMVPGRNLPLGGPEVLTGPELAELAAPFLRGGRMRTRIPALPPGDVSVHPNATRSALGWAPTERLRDALAADAAPAKEPGPVYQNGDPRAHPADTGAAWDALRGMGPALRRALHAALVADAARIGVDATNATLDFALARPGARRAPAHDGEIADLYGVRLRGPDGAVRHAGHVDFVRDVLAEELVVWWSAEDGIPEAIWGRLDLGVRRRLVKDPHFRRDPRVRAAG